MENKIDRILQRLWVDAMKLSPEEMQELATDLEDKADELRMVARDTEKRKDEQD